MPTKGGSEWRRQEEGSGFTKRFIGITKGNCMSKIYVIHENYQWFEPIKNVLLERHLPFESWYMESGSVHLSELPQKGVYFSKMSASSSTRDHRFSPDYAFALLSYLEANKSRVINGSNVLRLEISKVEQYICLKKSGIPVPETAACFGKHHLLETARRFKSPFILKPNRGGKGIGVQLFRSHHLLEEYLSENTCDESVDGIMLIQEYIESPEPFVTRLEFIGGKFVYAVRVDTSEGFELCPAEACRVDVPAQADEFCAIDARGGLFEIIEGFNHPIIGKLEAFLHHHSIEIAGVEFIRDKNDGLYVYDVNTNTNYNPEAEEKAGVSALQTLADFLEDELKKQFSQ